MTDIVEFITAQLERDDAHLGYLLGRDSSQFQRTLRDIAAKRAIVAEFVEVSSRDMRPDPSVGLGWVDPIALYRSTRRQALTFVLGHLASQWSDHPDYQDTWVGIGAIDPLARPR